MYGLCHCKSSVSDVLFLPFCNCWFVWAGLFGLVALIIMAFAVDWAIKSQLSYLCYTLFGLCLVGWLIDWLVVEVRHDDGGGGSGGSGVFFPRHSLFKTA